MPTQLDVCRAALAQTGTRSNINSLSDGSEEATYLSILYGPLRDFLLTEGEYDFAIDMLPVGQLGQPFIPWLFAYVYPNTALKIRQMVPLNYDFFNPLPVEWTVAGVGGIKQILTKERMSYYVITKAVAEPLWNPMFTEAFTRLLSSALLYALRNNIAPSKEKLSEAISFAGIASLRTE